MRCDRAHPAVPINQPENIMQSVELVDTKLTDGSIAFQCEFICDGNKVVLAVADFKSGIVLKHALDTMASWVEVRHLGADYTA
jgi:hypothetical protein